MMDLNTSNKIYQNYKKSFLDDSIVKFFQSRDKSSFGNADKIFFFKELAYMLKGGVGLIQAIKTIRQGSSNFAFKEIADGINKYLTAGHSLSYALGRLPDYFDEGDANIIRAGEKSGNLVLVLESLSEEYEYIGEIKNKYIGALIYPVILVVIAIIAVIALFGFVLPPVFEIAMSFSTSDLPWTTKALKGFSDFLVNGRKTILIVFSCIAVVLWMFFSTDSGKKTRFKILLEIPLIGQMTKYYYLVRWCRYMRLMLISGMNYVETFKTLRDVLRIGMYQEMIERILAGLQRGETIYNSLKTEHDLIPSNVVVLVRVGEETANLQNSIGNVLKMYQEELDNTINKLSKVIEPIMLVFIGAIVAVIAAGVFGIIFQLMEGI